MNLVHCITIQSFNLRREPLPVLFLTWIQFARDRGFLSNEGDFLPAHASSTVLMFWQNDKCHKQPFPDVAFQRGEDKFWIGSKSLGFFFQKFFIFSSIKTAKQVRLSTIFTFLNHFTCIPLGNTKNRGIGLFIENFNSEILNFEAFFFKNSLSKLRKFLTKLMQLAQNPLCTMPQNMFSKIHVLPSKCWNKPGPKWEHVRNKINIF